MLCVSVVLVVVCFVYFVLLFYVVCVSVVFDVSCLVFVKRWLLREFVVLFVVWVTMCV